MRPFRRYSLPKKMWFAVLLVAASACGAGAQTPASALPQAWSDAVKSLADKIAAIVSPTHPVALSVENISSLDTGDADAVRTALAAQLAQHHFRLARVSSSVDTHLEVTLSESTDSYVWVTEIRASDSDTPEPEIAVVSVAKSSGSGDAKSGATLTVQKTLVWQQSARFLDFRVTVGTDGTGSSLEVLEPARVAVYTQQAGKWSLNHDVAIAHRGQWPRDLRGSFNDATASGQVSATLSGVSCAGSAAQGGSIVCTGTPLSGEQSPGVIPGRDTGEAAVLKATCGDAQVALASGNGDWTQPDTIRGYLVRKKSATASGAAIDFAGPVLSIATDGDGEARAIVLNLKTGNYEGYSVSATCGE
jgi:hypothetical protein